MDGKPTDLEPSADEFLYVPTAETDAQQVLSHFDNIRRRMGTPNCSDCSRPWNGPSSIPGNTGCRRKMRAGLSPTLSGIDGAVSGTITPAIDANFDDGFYDAFNLVNEWKVEQKLPYGGSLRPLVGIDLEGFHNRVRTEDDPMRLTSEFILGACCPYSGAAVAPKH